MRDEPREEELRQFIHDFDLITTGRYSNPKQSIHWLLKERRWNLKRLSDEKRPNPTKLKDAMIDVWAAELLQWTEAPPTFEALQGAAVTIGASIEVDWTSEAHFPEMISRVEESIRVWVEEVYPGVLPEDLPTWTAQKRQLDKCLWWANVLLESYRRGWTMGGSG
jgi:hypothetical protein